MTAPRPDGSQAARCIRNALAEARVSPGEVGYVNAHGSSTPLNDPTETSSVKQVFGEHAYRLAVQRHQGVLRPRPGRQRRDRSGDLRPGQPAALVSSHRQPGAPDPACDLAHVTGEGRSLDPDYLLSNSFGFGGINAALVFRKADA